MLRATALVPAFLVCASASARANPHSQVPSAGTPNHHAHFELDYQYQLDSATVAREGIGIGSDPSGPIRRTDDLQFNQYRHVLTPRLEVGVFRDTWLSVALPITIRQARELELATGIDRANSTTLRDGLLPMNGFDARDPGATPPGNLVFRGVTRNGIDQVHAGLGVAPMNQLRDDTKPTWKLGAELRIAIGAPMKFDPMAPASETSVGRGVHELRLFTSVARTYSAVEAWFELFWQRAIGTKSGSLFDDPGFGSSNVDTSQLAGVSAGLELYAVNDKASGNRISLDLGARAISHFEGREYSEMWEIFTYAGDSRTTGPLVLDRDPTDMGVQAMSHPGVTNVENYLETTGRLAVRAALGANVTFAAVVDLTWKTDHAISFSDAGVDLDNDDLVNPGTREVNPLHVPVIDLVGHRYLSEDNFGFAFGVQGLMMF